MISNRLQCFTIPLMQHCTNSFRRSISMKFNLAATRGQINQRHNRCISQSILKLIKSRLLCLRPNKFHFILGQFSHRGSNFSEVFNKPSVKLHKAKKASYIMYICRCGPFFNSSNFLRINIHTLCTNVKTKKSNPLQKEFTLLKLSPKFIFTQTI